VTAKNGVRDALWISAAILALHLVLARSYPVIYGGDTIVRLVNLPRISISYQLPLFQLLLRAAVGASRGPFAVWFLMGSLAALGGAGLYALVREITADRGAAVAAALFYATHPFLLYYSRVPYQESLVAALVFWGFYFLFSACGPRPLPSSLALGLAALTRYEAWLASALAAAFYALRGRPTAKASLAAAALFGWGPALWIAWNGGISPPGTYLLDGSVTLERLYRPYFIVKTAVWWSAAGFTALAVMGIAAMLADRKLRNDPRLRWLLLFAALSLALLVFSGHGVAPDPARLVTEREAFVPLGILALCSGVGAAALAAQIQRALPRMGRAVAAAVVCVVAAAGLVRAQGRIAAANLEPELRTDYEVARHLQSRGAAAIVLARPLPSEEIDRYLRRAEELRGPEGRRAAERVLAGMETTPFDYQRVVVHSWLGKERVFSSGAARGLDRAALESFLRERRIERAVVFSDFRPEAEYERILLELVSGRAPEAEIRHGAKGARIYPLGGS